MTNLESDGFLIDRPVPRLARTRMGRIKAGVLIKCQNFRENLSRVIVERDEHITRAVITLGLMTSSNTIITNTLSLCGWNVAAQSYGIAAGVLTIVLFFLQTGLFDNPQVPAALF